MGKSKRKQEARRLAKLRKKQKHRQRQHAARPKQTAPGTVPSADGKPAPAEGDEAKQPATAPAKKTGRPRQSAPAKKAPSPLERFRRTAWYAGVKDLEALIQAHGPDGALLRLDDATVALLRASLKQYAGGKLSEPKRELLEGLGLDLQDLAKTRDWLQWRRNFFAYWKRFGEGEPPVEAEVSENTVYRWIARQCALKGSGELEAWKTRLLEGLGLDWERPPRKPDRRDEVRRHWLEKLEVYLGLQARHGEPVPVAELDRARLRPWVARVREQYARGTLDPDLREIFAKRGFELDAGAAKRRRYEARWNRHIKRLLAFKERFGHPMVPATYSEDPKLGKWLAQQRERWSLGKLDPAKVRQLEEIGVPASRTREDRVGPGTHLSVWKKRYEALKALLEREHGGKVPRDAPLPEREKTWLKRQAMLYEKGRLDEWEVEALRAIGFDPAEAPEFPRIVSNLDALEAAAVARLEIARKEWERRFKKLEAFVAEHGHAQVSSTHPDRKLHLFVTRNRVLYRRGRLERDKIERLEGLGFVFDTETEPTAAWMACYERLKAYRAEHGDAAVPRQYPPDQALAEFVSQQKQRGRKGMLYESHIRLLDELDFPWVRGERPIVRR